MYALLVTRLGQGAHALAAAAPAAFATVVPSVAARGPPLVLCKVHGGGSNQHASRRSSGVAPRTCASGAWVCHSGALLGYSWAGRGVLRALGVVLALWSYICGSRLVEF